VGRDADTRTFSRFNSPRLNLTVPRKFLCSAIQDFAPESLKPKPLGSISSLRCLLHLHQLKDLDYAPLKPEDAGRSLGSQRPLQPTYAFFLKRDAFAQKRHAYVGVGAVTFLHRNDTHRRAAELRHTHAAELAQERFPANLIQQLGHANLSVTSRYLDHIMPHERVEALKGREWRV